MQDSDRLGIFYAVTNENLLNIGPFGNTHRVGEVSPEMLMGDCQNQVSVVWQDYAQHSDVKPLNSPVNAQVTNDKT